MSHPLNRVDPRRVMSFANQHDSQNQQLSWHVPVEEHAQLRAKALQLVFAGLICLGVILLFGSRSFRLAALVGTIPLGLFVVWRMKAGARRRVDATDNVRLDNEGLHWRDDRGGERRISRDQIEAFRIGIDPDTIRALPALTLILAGGFESQPVELHAPVGPSHVRQFLVDQMKIDESQQDQRLAARLHEALAVACENDGHLLEMRVLLCGLIAPERMPDGTWRVARLLDGREVFYLPNTCRYQCRTHERSVELADIAELADHIRNEILVAREDDLQRLLATLELQRNQQAELELRRDASRLGFYVEFDPQGRLHFEGSKTGLLGLCDRLADAAERLRATPFGARPATINIAGTAVRLDVVLADAPWCDDTTLAGPRSFLHAVARQLRTRLSDEPGSDFFVKIMDADFQPQSFCIHLRSEPYDPLARMEAVDGHA